VVSVHAVVMALVLVVPVDDVDRAILIVALIQCLRPGVIEVQEILAVFTDITGSLLDRNIHVQALAMDVSHENFPAIFRRPTITQVTHHPGVGMAAAHRSASSMGRMRPALARPMHMIPVLLDVFVNVGMNGLAAAGGIAARLLGVDGIVLSTLPFNARALNHMPEMRNDAHLGKELPVLIEVDSPGITAALRENLKLVTSRMVSPNTRVAPLPAG